MKPRSICKPPQYGSPESLQLPSKRWMQSQPRLCGGCAASQRMWCTWWRQYRSARAECSGAAECAWGRPITACQRQAVLRRRRTSAGFTWRRGVALVSDWARRECLAPGLSGRPDAAASVDAAAAPIRSAANRGKSRRFGFTAVTPPLESDSSRLYRARPRAARQHTLSGLGRFDLVPSAFDAQTCRWLVNLVTFGTRWGANPLATVAGCAV